MTLGPALPWRAGEVSAGVSGERRRDAASESLDETRRVRLATQRCQLAGRS